MTLIKIKTVYDETFYIDPEEYQHCKAQGRNLIRVYFSTGRLRTIRRKWRREPETMLLHVENIKEGIKDVL